MKPIISIKKITAAAILLVTLAGCGGKPKQAGPGGQGGPPQGPAPYQVAQVYDGSATMNYSFPATIEGQQNVEIRPKVDGFISRMFVDEGAVVRKGQPLFQLNNPQYEQAARSAAAQVKIAGADVQTAQMDVEKVAPLVEKNIISKYELQSKQYTLQSRRAALSAAQAELANARVNAGYTFISSPSDGVIGTIPYKQGSLVSSTTGSPLTTVYNIKNIFAYFSMNEKQLLSFSRQLQGNTFQDKLTTTQDVSLVLADGSAFPDKGRITTASGLISTATGSAKLRATFPNPGNLVRSGSSATVKMPVTIDTALLIPQGATYDFQGKKFVYKMVTPDSISNVAIEVDEITIGNLFIVKKGLQKGDKVVVEGVASIKGPTRIKPVPANQDSLYMAVRKTGFAVPFQGAVSKKVP